MHITGWGEDHRKVNLAYDFNLRVNAYGDYTNRAHDAKRRSTGHHLRSSKHTKMYLAVTTAMITCLLYNLPQKLARHGRLLKTRWQACQP